MKRVSFYLVNINMYMNMYMHVYVYIYVYKYIYFYTYIYIYAHTYMYIPPPKYIYIQDFFNLVFLLRGFLSTLWPSTCIWICICMYIYKYMYIHICIFLYIYTYICIHVYIPSPICIYIQDLFKLLFLLRGFLSGIWPSSIYKISLNCSFYWEGFFLAYGHHLYIRSL
jgi:hypothetical protein